MARTAPLVENATLHAGGGQAIALGTPAWQRWLEEASSFAFHGRAGRFTARKERRGRADGYWRAYRRQRGTLRSAYLGMSANLTLERLEEVAQALAEAAPPPAPNAQFSIALSRTGTAAPRRPRNLPVPATALVGRERDVSAVKAALQRADLRLLTLVGPGGVGKTRLALQVARELCEHFADGVFLVDLASIGEYALVIPTIMKTLGLAEAGDQAARERLDAYLATKQILLLLDNFEQVLAAAPSVAALLAAAPQLKLLVTSRAVLQIGGEHEYPVPPLSHAEGAHAAAVTLFVQRAQAVKPGFALAEANAPLLAEICRRLDGLPLAIELAAARIKLFSPAALLHRLEHRLPLLTGGARDLPARQQTLSATCDWSYQLLDAPLQMLFRQLAVFAGGFSFEGVEAVCTEPDGLAALVDQSLLSAGEDPAGEPRFSILGIIHDYALELLKNNGEEPAFRRRHALYYLNLAERAEPELSGPNARFWLDRLEVELPNLRAALNWSVASDAVELAASIASALAVFWDLRGDQREGQRWLEAIQATGLPLSSGLHARLLRALGYLAQARFDRNAAIAHLEASLALYRELGDERGCIAVLAELGWAYAALDSDAERATVLLEEGLSRARHLNDRSSIAQALQGLGWVAQLRAFGIQPGIQLVFTENALVKKPEHLDTARKLYAEALALRRATGDARGIAWLLQSLGYAARVQGEYQAARAFQEERLQLERTLGNRHGVASTSVELGHIARSQGDLSAARTWLAAGLALAREVSNFHIMALALMQLGDLALACADYAEAKALWEEALVNLHRIHDEYRSAMVRSLLVQASHTADQDVKAADTRAATQNHSGLRRAGLTRREGEVLLLLAEGLSNADIASRLVVSAGTVRTYLSAIYGKIGVRSRTAAMRYVIDQDMHIPRKNV